MNELLLVVRTSAGERDIAVGFDGQASIAQLAERLAEQLGPTTGGTLERLSRRRTVLAPDAAIARSDLRSGDVVRLALDTGVREVVRSEVVARVRVRSADGDERGLDVLRGETLIGRSARCDLSIDDELASRRHAKLIATDVIEVVDLASTNGTTVNDTLIVAPRRLRDGDRIGIGDTTITVTKVAVAEAAADTTGNQIEFNRPPRRYQPFPGVELELPAPPDAARRQRLPMISALVPVLMGVALYLLTRSIYSVVFIALSPLMLLGSWWENRRSGRAEHADKVAEHARDVEELVAELDAAIDAEVSSRYEAAPAVGSLQEHVRTLSPRLWERQPAEDGFLEVRIGVAPLPARSTVSIADGGERGRREPLHEIVAQTALLPPVPVTLRLGTVRNLGIAGPEPVVSNLARSVLAQACVLHSPSELVVCALLHEKVAEDWAWLKWFPHTRSPLSPLGEGHLAWSVDRTLDLLDALTALIVDREAAEQPGSRSGPPLPTVLVLVHDALPLERARLSALLERGPDHGVHVLWISGTVRRLPKACAGVIEVSPSGDGASVSDLTEPRTVEDVVLEPLDLQAATRLAQDLAPIIDVSSGRSRDAGIPRTVSMVELLGGTRLLDDTQEVLDRWRESASSRQSSGLRVPIGVGATGPFSLDLRHDGPHGLVAGTTGAGKSELLQSLLIGLAVTYPPERISFLLVDYKGGSAFKDCVGLPHTVGLVTDLTPALVLRALTSLRAELHRRERLLNDAGAKDLLAMETSGHPQTPPSLVIVVDEFAALAREVPQFVEGVVDIAQRGRSLGLHLLLATQRPQGVITDNIRANTNLKIALRVASDDESTDVVGTPVAGQIDRSLSGRAVARLGPSDLISFQTGYAGGHTSPADTDAELHLEWFEADARRPWEQPVHGRADPVGATDLERLTATVARAHHHTGSPPPRRPWLDPLHDRYDLLRVPHTGDDTALPIGVADEPARQWQRIATFDPDRDGNLLVYGAGGSGKTVALRTLAASASLSDAGHPVHVYAVDAAGRGLDLLRPLPQVGAVIGVDDYERLTRLLETLAELVEERAEQLAAHQASTLAELRTNTAGALGPLPRVLLLVDGFENLQSTYERIDRGKWYDLILRLANDGRSAGLHLVLTGTRRTSFPTALTATVGRRLILRLASADEYSMLGVDPALVDGDEPPGRAVDGSGVVQLAIAGTRTDTPGQARSLRELGAGLEAEGTAAAPAIEVLGERVAAAGLLEHSHPGGLVIGRDDRLHAFTLATDAPVLIAGPARSGRSTTLATLAHACCHAGQPPVVLAARRAIEGLPTGATQHLGMEAVQAALEQLVGRDPCPAVLIDGLEDLLDGPADLLLERLLARPGPVLIAACETSVARRYSTTVNQLKRSRRVVVLQPDLDLDGDLLGAPVPRSLRPFPPGRGIASDGGTLTVMQVAWPE